MARVAVVDDHPLFRMGVGAALAQAGHNVVDSIGQSAEAIPALRESNAEVILLDQRMSPIKGTTILNSLREDRDNRPILFLTNEISDDELVRIIELKGNGVVLKDSPLPELLNAIDLALSGGRFFAHHLLERLIGVSGNNNNAKSINNLTRRESEISSLVASGKSNKEIGRELNISEGTVKVNLHNIYKKTGIDNRTMLAVMLNADRHHING